MSVGIVDKSTGDRIQTAGNPLDKVGDLSLLHTTAKSNAVAAINEVADELATKQDTLTFDDAPTDGSNNPVKSNGVYDALALKQNATDNSLDTDAKTIVGAINEHEGDIGTLKSGLTNLDNEVNGDSTTYPYADVITIDDAVPANLADCTVKIEPVQDLHGQSAPYVGGAGKQKLPLDLAILKTLNTSGTWVDNVYTLNDITATCNLDDGGNVVSIKTNGTASATFFFLLGNFADILTSGTSYTINSNIYPTSDSAYLQIRKANDAGYLTLTGEYEFEYTSDGNFQKFGIRVDNAVTVNNVVLQPMLRLSTETDATFAPYTNYCPISGHAEASVQRTGKNLFNVSRYPFVDSYFIKATDGTAQPTSSAYKASSVYIHCSHLRGKTLVLNKRPGGNDTGIAFYESESVNSYISGVRNAGGEAGTPMTFTVPDNANYFKFTVPLSATDVQIEIGTESTPYVPYAGKTYTIALGDTIYGGTVDFDSGVMTVTHTLIEFDGTENWRLYGSGSASAYSMALTKSPSSLSPNPLYCISNSLDVIGANDTYGNYYAFISTNSANNWVAGIRTITTAEDWKTYLASNPVQLCYPLATPTTIQLTPQQIQLLKGTNTLTASTGNISVTVNGVSGAIGALTEDVAELSDNFDEVIGWSDRRNLFDAKHVAIEELPNATGTLQYGCKFAVVAGKKYTVSSNMTETLYLFSKTGTDAAVNIFTLTSTKSFSFTAATNTIYYLRNASSTTVDTFRNKLLNGEVQLEEGSVATNYQTFHPIIGNAVDGLIDRVPTAPTTDGTYNLQVTVSSGTPTYSWVSTT